MGHELRDKHEQEQQYIQQQKILLFSRKSK